MQEYPFAWLYFISFILVSSFVIMNVIVGIIVNAVSEVSSHTQEKEKSENKNDDETSISIINTSSNCDTDNTATRLREKRLHDEAKEEEISQERFEGIAEGIAAGKIEILIELVKAGNISVQMAAAKVSMSESDFEALCAKN